jgi:hypothetical protein
MGGACAYGIAMAARRPVVVMGTQYGPSLAGGQDERPGIPAGADGPATRRWGKRPPVYWGESAPSGILAGVTMTSTTWWRWLG